MTKEYALLVFLIALTFGHQGCKKSSDTVMEPPVDTNLIGNSSFEYNGIASLQGWKTSDTSAVKFSRDVPSGGESWSIYIETVWAPPVRVQTTVPASPGTHPYKLSTWAKAQGVAGKVSLIFNKAVRKTLNISDSTWVVYTITDTLTTVAGDSLVIELAGGFSQLLTGRTYYDLCKFEKSD